MTELPRHPKQSTEPLRALDGWFERGQAAIMASEKLVPSAKKKHLEELQAEYRTRWTLAKHAADKDLQEWSEIFQARAESATAPKMPADKDARILKSLELQRLHNRIERARSGGRPGPLLAEYDRAVHASDHVAAHELEEALPELLPDDARRDFERRAQENRLARLSGEDRKKVEEHREFERERVGAAQGLALRETNRQRGYLPGGRGPTMLVTARGPGGVMQTYEEANPAWRPPDVDRPADEPRGGTIVADPGQRGRRESAYLGGEDGADPEAPGYAGPWGADAQP